MSKSWLIYPVSCVALVLTNSALLAQSNGPRDAWLMRNYRFAGPPPPGSIGPTDPVVGELRQIQNTLLSIMRKADFERDYEAALAAAAQAATNAQLIGAITQRLDAEADKKTIAAETPTPTTSNEATSTTPAAIYSIVFKNHSMESATAYWIDESMLNYLTHGGAHVIVRLDLVDRERTIELNRLKNLQFNLPE